MEGARVSQRAGRAQPALLQPGAEEAALQRRVEAALVQPGAELQPGVEEAEPETPQPEAEELGRVGQPKAVARWRPAARASRRC